jgi:hypothetical protein
VGWRFYNSFGEEKSESALFVGPSAPPSPGMLWLDTDEPPSALPGTLLDVQRITGNSAAYKVITTGQRLTINANGIPDLALSYTPPVNAWWEVDLLLGLLNKTDAAYHYAQCILQCQPNDADGVSTYQSYIMQHATVQTYEAHTITGLYKLTAGVPYQTYAQVTMSGGTWQYNQGPTVLSMHAKAWAR